LFSVMTAISPWTWYWAVMLSFLAMVDSENRTIVLFYAL
jgi:hypothetical protein